MRSGRRVRRFKVSNLNDCHRHDVGLASLTHYTHEIPKQKGPTLSDGPLSERYGQDQLARAPCSVGRFCAQRRSLLLAQYDVTRGGSQGLPGAFDHPSGKLPETYRLLSGSSRM